MFSHQVPFFVNATSGSTVLGAYDDLEALAEVCAKHKVISDQSFALPENFDSTRFGFMWTLAGGARQFFQGRCFSHNCHCQTNVKL